MESLERLPEPLGEIEIPPYLIVSRLATAGPCLLRAIPPLQDRPDAPVGPRAELGNVVHTLADLAVRGRLGSGRVPADVEEAFEYLLAQAAMRLSKSEKTRGYAELRVGFTKREWEKRRYLAIMVAKEVLRRQGTARSIASAKRKSEPLSLQQVLLRKFKTAAEVPFESPTLRLRGRIDLVELEEPDGATISDFKSGSVADGEGALNHDTSLQLRLYGLAAAELAPERHITLRVLGQDGELPLPFDDEQRRSVWEWLHGILEALPAGAHFDASTLAVIGPQCMGCKVRPVCPAYRIGVRETWKRKDNPFELPLDIAGTVVGREKQDVSTFR